MMRIGHGFDVHKFGGVGPCMLGGVAVPYEQGLLAHSDGDVVLHAVSDALLGAIGAGDIGRHFPDTSAEFKGIDSRILLRDVFARVQRAGYAIGNLDVTIIAQAPKMAPHIDAMCAVLGTPTARGILKAEAADFVVNEDLGFAPCGEGEHIFVRVRKTGENTAWVAGLLADAAGVARNAVTWAGLKDRHAVTEQWFGIHLPGKGEPDLSVIENDNIRILEVKRHNKKLRVGYLKGNHFTLRLTGLEQADGLESRLQAIATQGVPNYYGEQRFGRGGNNLEAAKAMFAGKRIKDRNKRSLYLSAARSMLFNAIVSARIEQGRAGGTPCLRGRATDRSPVGPWPSGESGGCRRV